MKKTVAFAGILLFPLTSLSAEVGITGAVGGMADFRIPIKTNDFIFEPYLSHYLHGETQERDADYKYRRSGAGIGVWKLVGVNEYMYAQVGLQLGYLSDHREGGYISQVDEEVSGSVYTAESDGYLVSPGFGLFYTVAGNFDIGVEVKYQYESLSGERSEITAGYPEYSWENEPTARIEETNSRVQTQAVFRLYF